MNAFELEPVGGPIDLGLTLTSGQVFRWQQHEDGWRGVDGDAWAFIQESGQKLLIKSNQVPAFWQHFFLSQTATLPESLGEHPVFTEYAWRTRGLRLLTPSDPVESLFSFLCTANNHLIRIGAMVRSLAAHGEPFEDSDLCRFPELAVIAAIPELRLRELGFGYRARTIPLVAQELLARGGRPYLESLKSESLSTVREHLTGIPSIGPKLADCIALYALHHRRAVPVDTHLWQAAIAVQFPEWAGQNLTAKKVLAIQEFFEEVYGDDAAWVHLVMYYGHLRMGRVK